MGSASLTLLTAGLSLRPSGYHGLYCEEEYNECLSAPCLNAATCRDLVNGYECVCLADYKGEHCSLIGVALTRSISQL